MYTRAGKDKFIKFIFYSTTRGAVTNSVVVGKSYN